MSANPFLPSYVEHVPHAAIPLGMQARCPQCHGLGEGMLRRADGAQLVWCARCGWAMTAEGDGPVLVADVHAICARAAELLRERDTRLAALAEGEARHAGEIIAAIGRVERALSRLGMDGEGVGLRKGRAGICEGGESVRALIRRAERGEATLGELRHAARTLEQMDLDLARRMRFAEQVQRAVREACDRLGLGSIRDLSRMLDREDDYLSRLPSIVRRGRISEQAAKRWIARLERLGTEDMRSEPQRDAADQPQAPQVSEAPADADKADAIAAAIREALARRARIVITIEGGE